MKRYLNFGIIFVIFLTIVLSGCGISHPVQTIQFEDDGNGFLQFYTNDSQYYNYRFTHTYSSPANPTNIEVAVKKRSGYAYSAYGIVFGYQDIHNFYEVVICVDGEYAIFKMVNDSWDSIINWNSSSDLAQGYNQYNTIKLVKVDATNYTVTFNNGTAIPFNDVTFSSGRYGFITFVASSTEEKFPGTPEDVKFIFTSEVTGASLTPARTDLSYTESGKGSGR